MARRFTVSFDLDFTDDVEPALVAVMVSDLLDAEEFDHTDVEVKEPELLDPEGDDEWEEEEDE